MSQNQHFDVIVSGGGLSGLLTAIGLLRECPTIEIAIVEPFDDSSDNLKSTPSFDDRCLALSYGSLQLLNHWQVWPLLKPSAWPIKTIVTSDRGHIGKTVMRAEDYKLSAMGYVAPMEAMGQAFKQALDAVLKVSHGRLTWFKPNKINNLKQNSDEVLLELSNAEHISADLLVVAEGGNSPTRSKLNIDVDTRKYEQAAVIANVQVSTEGNADKILARSDTKVFGHVAYERFTTSGPIAFLPLAEDQFSVVWSIKPEQQDAVMALSDEQFCDALQNEFGFVAGRIVNTSRRQVYPLQLVKAQQIISHRVALVGNAGHTVHPIAGQGFNLGLRDIAVLVQQIKESVAQQQNIGEFSMLSRYQHFRMQDIDRITGFTDLLVRGFALEGRLPALARTSGLLALQKIDCLQQWLALHFMSSKVLPGIPNINN